MEISDKDDGVFH